MSLLQNIENAETDAIALSKFLNDPATSTVPRRIADSIKPLQYYLDYLNALKSMVENPDGTVTINGTTLKTIAQSVKDAISTAGVQNGVADNLVAVKNTGIIGAVARTQADKNADFVSVKDFGAKGDGVANDTQAILQAVNHANSKKSRLHFPCGRYWFDGGAVLAEGVIVSGDSYKGTTIFSRLALPSNGYLFKCEGWGSGIENIGFVNGVTQTGGCYVSLSGVKSYIHGFDMTGDIKGVSMTGVLARIEKGYFNQSAQNAIRIDVGGGDTSQIIDNITMGAVSDRTVAKAGIRVNNSAALMITNTSVITMGVGLLIESSTDTDRVFSLYANNCFFDNCVYGMRVLTYGNGAVMRCRFSNCWFSSSTNDGVSITNDTVKKNISGLHFDSSHIMLNAGSGVSLGNGLTDISFNGGELCQNKHGFYFNQNIDLVKIANVTIGKGAGLNANTENGIVIGAVALDNSLIVNNVIVGNANSIVINTNNVSSNLTIEDNIGYKNKSNGVATISNQAEIIITHSLISPPKSIVVTPLNSNLGTTTYWAGSVTATTFKIHTAGNVNAVFSWTARI